MAGLVPAVKITREVKLIGAGSPLTVDPVAVVVMNAEIMMGVGKILQGAAAGEKTVFRAVVKLHAKLNIALKRLELRVQFQYSIHHHSQSLTRLYSFHKMRQMPLFLLYCRKKRFSMAIKCATNRFAAQDRAKIKGKNCRYSGDCLWGEHFSP